MLFSPISYKNNFSKTQGIKLGAIITPSKVLEQPLKIFITDALNNDTLQNWEDSDAIFGSF